MTKAEKVQRSRFDSHNVYEDDHSGRKKQNQKVICTGEGHGHQGLPYDLPVRLVIHRLMSKFEKKNFDKKKPIGLRGWVVEHEIFRRLDGKTGNFDVAMKVHIKIVRDGRVAIFVDGEKVYEENALD